MTATPKPPELPTSYSSWMDVAVDGWGMSEIERAAARAELAALRAALSKLESAARDVCRMTPTTIHTVVGTDGRVYPTIPPEVYASVEALRAALKAPPARQED